jgi:DNA gyrase C-terminal domain, beta-propeller
VIRTSAGEIKQSGRQTMGVRLVNLASGQSLVAIARNAEALVNGNLDAEEGIEEDAELDADGSAAALAGSTDAEAADVVPNPASGDGDESPGQGDPSEDTDR